MTGKQARRFDRAFKMAALERMAAGENVSAPGRELGVRRKLLHQRRETVRRGGVEALRGVGRPRTGERTAGVLGRPRAVVPRGVAAPDELAQAREREALRMALVGREVIPGGLVHHSDRGGQYARGDDITLLERHGIQPSMSRPGCPYDNAPARAPARAPCRDGSTALPSMAESFVKTLKQEEVDGRTHRTLADAKGSIGSFIEQVDNRQRLHSALDYLAPTVFEATTSRPGAAAQQPRATAATDRPQFPVSASGGSPAARTRGHANSGTSYSNSGTSYSIDLCCPEQCMQPRPTGSATINRRGSADGQPRRPSKFHHVDAPTPQP